MRDDIAHQWKLRVSKHSFGIVTLDAVLDQLLVRQIKAADLGVFIEVAQNVRQLQSPAEVVSERNTVLAVHSENSHRQSSDCTCHAVAIEVQRFPTGRADVLGRIHFHAIDYGEKIFLAQRKGPYRMLQSPQIDTRLSGIKSLDVLPPFRKPCTPGIVWSIGVGNIVDKTTERIDFEHCVALRAGQDAHGGVKRAARCAARGGAGLTLAW